MFSSVVPASLSVSCCVTMPCGSMSKTTTLLLFETVVFFCMTFDFSLYLSGNRQKQGDFFAVRKTLSASCLVPVLLVSDQTLCFESRISTSPHMNLCGVFRKRPGLMGRF